MRNPLGWLPRRYSSRYGRVGASSRVTTLSVLGVVAILLIIASFSKFDPRSGKDKPLLIWVDESKSLSSLPSAEVIITDVTPSLSLAESTSLETVEAAAPASSLTTTLELVESTRPTSLADVPLKTWDELPCRSLPGAKDVVLVMKTGATELYSQALQHLLTISKCSPNLEIFSDLEQHIGEFHIQDALDEISDEYKNTHGDFELYRELQKYHAEYRDVSKLGKNERGWNLDKWKFIPVLHKVYLKHPDAKWYAFIEADTYLGWTNLLQLVGRLDSTKSLYFGFKAPWGDISFGQGGCGYVISNAAARRFEETRDAAHMAKWEHQTSTHCCGDVMLGMALLDANINITQAHPMFQPDTLPMFDFGEENWCRPAISWHHVRPVEVEVMWEFEQAWINRTSDQPGAESIPYLYKDVFEYLIQPHVSADRSDWDNLSRHRSFHNPSDNLTRGPDEWEVLTDEQKQLEWDSWSDDQRHSVESKVDCYSACIEDPGCLQWCWRPGSCSHEWGVRLGYAAHPDNETVSGWMMERLEKFKQERWEPCAPTWEFHT